ncbi:helix-turn-helix domain-containing protein [Sporosarcina sp. FSL K6-3457]|uniref:helix-turn-helix domain-containing protein n=1 Tax=Sporosarcina sp. FSL K6-3457 TaxID=2978204 RepID=UPI0040469988
MTKSLRYLFKLNVSSLHQLRKVIDRRLRDCSLKLSRNPLQLTGDESLIRCYLQKLKTGIFGESRLIYTSYVC